MNPKTAGVLAVLAASVMWAIEPVFVKLSYSNADFIQTSAVKAIIVALIALTYAFLTRGKFRLNKREVSTVFYVAIVAVLFADLMYFYALTTVPTLNAVLIAHMQPIFIVLIGFFILKKDKLTKFDYLGIAFMIVAGLLVTTKTLQNFSQLRLGTFGDLLVLSATIAWATTAIAMRKYLRGVNAGVITFYRYAIASVAFAIYLLPASALLISNLNQIFVGIVVGLGTILYYEGLRRIKAAQVSALELSAPFFAAVFAFLFLQELVTPLQALGIGLLFGGIYFLARKE